MKRLTLAVIALTFALQAAAAPGPGECEIWLCLPAGFPPHIAACNKAKAEMIKRHWKGESPVPSFGECSKNGENDGMRVVYGVAARIRNTNPTQYKYGTRCYQRDHNDGGPTNITNTNPPNCSGTYNFYQAFQHGRPLGEIIHLRRRQ